MNLDWVFFFLVFVFRGKIRKILTGYQQRTADSRITRVDKLRLLFCFLYFFCGHGAFNLISNCYTGCYNYVRSNYFKFNQSPHKCFISGGVSLTGYSCVCRRILFALTLARIFYYCEEKVLEFRLICDELS